MSARFILRTLSSTAINIYGLLQHCSTESKLCSTVTSGTRSVKAFSLRILAFSQFCEYQLSERSPSLGVQLRRLKSLHSVCKGGEEGSVVIYNWARAY